MINFIDLKRRWEYFRTFRPGHHQSLWALDCQDILYLSCCAFGAPGCINKTGFVLGLLMMFGSLVWVMKAVVK